MREKYNTSFSITDSIIGKALPDSLLRKNRIKAHTKANYFAQEVL